MSKVYDQLHVNNDVTQNSMSSGGEPENLQDLENVPQSYNLCGFLRGDPMAPEYRELRKLLRQQNPSDLQSFLMDPRNIYSEEIKILLASIEISS